MDMLSLLLAFTLFASAFALLRMCEILSGNRKSNRE